MLTLRDMILYPPYWDGLENLSITGSVKVKHMRSRSVTECEPYTHVLNTPLQKVF